MKTILEAEEKIAQVWGYPKPKDTEYRLMKYLLRYDCQDGVLLHNVVTRHLVLLSETEATFIDGLPAKPSESVQTLIANHFLVPIDYDEYKAINQLRAIFKRRYTGDAINHYIILPTTYCNARCFYCYESGFPHVHMTEETGRKLINYIEEHHQGKDILLSWFGGEPLVGIKRIDQITQGLKDRGITFSSKMISNGYLFNEEIVERSVDQWKLNHIQITLDGTEEVYNKVKAYSDVSGNPFEQVLRNIDLLSDKGVFVTIRLNLDFYNKDNIRLLIEELGERFSGNEHVTVYLNMLFNNEGFDPISRTQDETSVLVEIIEEYSKRLRELKIGGHDRSGIPVLEFSQCMADNPHAVEVQPDGSFCRCEHESILDSYGSIDRGVFDEQKLKKWNETIERSDYCPECCFYPACYKLRNCMDSDTPCFDSFRLRFQKRQEERLYSVYLNKMEEIKNESI